MSDNSFQEMLNLDPLLLAEKITGKSYKDDKETSSLGLLLHIAKGEQVRDEMTLRDDTFYSSPFDDAYRIYGELGFEPVLAETFEESDGRIEKFVIFWRDGALATLESYTDYQGAVKVNSSDLYANWLPANKEAWKYTHSGGYSRKTPGYDDDLPEDPWVWAGHWDLRIGMRNTMDQLDNSGTFVAPWVGDPLMHLENRVATKQTEFEDWHDATLRRLGLLPSYVTQALGTGWERDRH
jgi:hypothetical protein